MGLFDNSSKNKNAPAKNIESIPYDYYGYDMVFEEGTTDPSAYAGINALITNSKMDMACVEGYDLLTEDSTEDDFWEFYGAWIDELEQNGFIVEFTIAEDINTFAADINKILRSIGASQLLNEEEVINSYRTEVVKYSFMGEPVNADFKYDILEANIVAAELRKIGYELIALFNGMDNDMKAVVPLDKVSALQELEGRIK